MDLSELRKGIDEIDNEILNLFAERMKLCKQVAKYKEENNLPVFQGNREIEILNKIVEKAPVGLADGSRALFSNIMDISKCLQQQEMLKNTAFPVHKELDLMSAKKIGCQGVAGANSETAAKMLFGNKNIVFFHDFEDVFKAVEDGEIDFGVLPIQNSTMGSVIATYDLMKKYNCYISSMARVEISHCLAVKKGTKFTDIEAVYSHPQALSQCSAFTKKTNLKTVQYENTATAAQLVVSSECSNIAAICSEECAELYGLEILQKDIANSMPNYTRFICISKEFLVSQNAKTISVLITIPNTKGSLYRLLTKFFVNGLNLEKIESRPIAGGSFNVMFYLDFEGNINDTKVAALLKELENELESFKLLGNYTEQIHGI